MRKAAANSLKIWRLVHRQFAEIPWSSEGAALYGGRWNSVGRPAVYGAESQALAVLEVMVHLPQLRSLAEYRVAVLELPLAAVEEAPKKLPNRWQAQPPELASQQYGDNWLQQGKAAAMLLPSVILPDERNILINPAHPAFIEAQKTAAQPLNIDARLSGLQRVVD